MQKIGSLVLRSPTQKHLPSLPVSHDPSPQSRPNKDETKAHHTKSTQGVSLPHTARQCINIRVTVKLGRGLCKIHNHVRAAASATA
jgi:hypothetical protein